MRTGTSAHVDNYGVLAVTYTKDDGSSLGVEFTSASEDAATGIFSVCASKMGNATGRLVSSSSTGNTLKKTNDGGDDMEKRIAVLEAEVTHIRTDVGDLKKSSLEIDKTVNSLDKNMAIVLERLTAIKESLDKKPSTDAVEKRISDAKLAILLGVPGIIGVATAIYKAVSHFYFAS
ncbi:hypothetical protein PUG46_00205 [Erwiniaceae bacterium L1_55_4]|nr:hypothetical protein [Erwiniaceae bacterium L1_55_4]